MDNIEFWKMNGSGNDFILIDNRDGRIGEEAMGRLVERACRRRESVGADGVIFVTESDTYDFAWRFFNADGGEAEMCGNGGRCVSRFAYLKGIAGPRMTFGTLAGPISAEVDGRRVKVLMPQPAGWDRDIDVEPGKGWRSADYINAGVPHVVVRVDDIEDHPVNEQGRLLRYHDRFSPEGTNANFIKVTGDHRLELRTYERGVEDETLACGTGAIASALTASARGLVRSPVQVLTRGGEELTIHFESDGDSPGAFREVWLEGNTSIVYTGQLRAEAL
ncbi:MAG: diaminopimelate epimerase [Deltaproteobacteria bacterium]|nr:diaminopimelate epimerase [Deltaproteobacteria bacterium]MBW2285592.1 diaminopimelate epimerase [Deltaproteobacteria bacterium]